MELLRFSRTREPAALARLAAACARPASAGEREIESIGMLHDAVVDAPV